MDPFALNVAGVEDLVKNKTNKVSHDGFLEDEGVESEKFDAYKVSTPDIDLLKLREQFEERYAPYESVLKPRVEAIRNSYLGKNPAGQALSSGDLPISANLQFEAEETFLAAALSKNPDPVVYCDNTPEGNEVATAVKTMLQFHADQLALRRKLTMMTRQWSMDLLGVLVPGWNERISDVAIDNDKIRDYMFDPDGYVDAYGDFSSWYGKRKTVTAERLAELFPAHKAYITEVCSGRMGTRVTFTEWWPNDDYCFYTFKEKVLDKHKNQYFKYPEEEVGPTGEPVLDEAGKPAMTKPRNHFAYPKKPGIFLSVYSLQECPHDITSNTEQNISKQNQITRETEQADFNIAAGNNGYAFSEANFNQETGKQAANARKKGNPILIPEGGPIGEAILALPAQPLPQGMMQMIEMHKNDLRNSWGVNGLGTQNAPGDQTATEIIKDEQHDSTRIAGGIGDAIEQVADNAFNWLVQLYYVFYDDAHFAAVMGRAKAVEYIQMTAADMDRQVIVSVVPDSMKPKDEVTQMNLAQALFDKGAIGPKTLLKMVDFPDVDEAAADGVLFHIDPMSYFKLNFPEYAAKLQQVQQQTMMEQNAMGMAQGEQELQQAGAAGEQDLSMKGAGAEQAMAQKQQMHEQKMMHNQESHAQKTKLAGKV